MGTNSTTRFIRNYQCFIQTAAGTILVIQPPLTIEFDITRNLLTSANVCSIRITNLAEAKRNEIAKDAVNLIGDQRSIELRAGYGTNLIKIFSGNYTQAFSVREGTEWITTIECFDGGAAFANSFSSFTTGPNYPKFDIVTNLIADLGKFGIVPGVIGEIDGATLRSTTMSGPTTKLLAEITDGKFFVDQGRAHVLNDGDCLNGTVYTINADSGLLGTPILEQYIVNFEMVFEPSLVIGQRILLQSSHISRFNGYYKVAAVKHRGTISNTVGGSCTTSLSVQYGANLQVIGS